MLEVGKPMGSRAKDYHGKNQVRDVSLKCQVSVNGDKDVKETRRSRKKVRVANAGPFETGNGGNFVAANIASEPAIDAFVE